MIHVVIATLFFIFWLLLSYCAVRIVWLSAETQRIRIKYGFAYIKQLPKVSYIFFRFWIWDLNKFILREKKITKVF